MAAKQGFSEKMIKGLKVLAGAFLATAAIAAIMPATAGAAASSVAVAPRAAPSWLANNGLAARQLVQLLATARIEGLNPKRYNVGGVQRAIEQGLANPGARGQAEQVISHAFVDYVRDSRH